MSNEAKLYFTQEDYQLLESVIEKITGFQGELLENELERAEVVSSDEIPDNVVTLHSRARVMDETSTKEREITVVPPSESENASNGKVSVLAPLGAAVIGLSEGQVIDWPMPSGKSRRFRVIEVVYQPEAEKKP